MDERLMGDDRSIAYEENGISIYRASGIGSCLTALVAAKTGYEPARGQYQEKILTNAAREGNMHEPAIIEHLKAELGWRVWGGQDESEIRVIPKVFIRGHIDGICRPPGLRNNRLLEVKTMSSDRFKKWMSAGTNVRSRLMSDEFKTYGWQISTYMKIHGLPAMYVVKNRNTGELDISELKLPPVDWKTIKAKVIQAEMYAKRDELPPCAASSGDQFFCEYPYLHDADKVFEDEPVEDEPVFDTATGALIAGMAAHYADLAKQVSLLKPTDDERKLVGGKLIDAMGGPTGPEEVAAGGWLVKRRKGNRKTLDVVAAAEALGVEPDVFAAVLKDHTTVDNLYYYPQVKRIGDK